MRLSMSWSMATLANRRRVAATPKALGGCCYAAAPQPLGAIAVGDCYEFESSMIDWRNRSIIGQSRLFSMLESEPQIERYIYIYIFAIARLLGDRAFSMLESVFQIERYIYAQSFDCWDICAIA